MAGTARVLPGERRDLIKVYTVGRQEARLEARLECV